MSNPYFDPGKPHHTPEGFRNNHPHPGPGSFLKWQWERWRNVVPKPPAQGWSFPHVHPDAGWLAANRSQTAATWIGHATVLLQTAGLNILTDPHFTQRASPLAFAGPVRQMPPALHMAHLPHIDVVVISHNHYDHLDRDTVRHLQRQAGGPPLFLVPLGLKPWLRAEGIDGAVELDWWDTHRVGAVTFHLVPAQHWSARGLTDRNRTLWGGWVVEQPDFRFIFTGDTGYSADFIDIGRRFGGFDLAAIPIGAYEPRWFMRSQHVNPEEAVRIHQDLHSRQSIAVHWGTFVLTDEPLDEPPVRLREALRAAGVPESRFRVLKFGETLMPEPPPARSSAELEAAAPTHGGDTHP